MDQDKLSKHKKPCFKLASGLFEQTKVYYSFLNTKRIKFIYVTLRETKIVVKMWKYYTTNTTGSLHAKIYLKEHLWHWQWTFPKQTLLQGLLERVQFSPFSRNTHVFEDCWGFDVFTHFFGDAFILGIMKTKKSIFETKFLADSHQPEPRIRAAARVQNCQLTT
jgi:hypothetical protein